MPLRLFRPCLIVFDMDGTLIDVSESYRNMAPLAAMRYLETLGLDPPPLTGAIYDAFKRMGGFNDDWDLTAGILETLLAPLPPAPLLPATGGQEDLVRALRASAASLRGCAISAPVWEALIPPVVSAGGGLDGLRRVTGGRNRHLVRRGGGALSADLVERISAELYLGDRLFRECYGAPARFHHGGGLIERERLLISRATLASLAAIHPLGIATGRTRFETAQGMESHGLSRYFGAAATLTDAEEALDRGEGDGAISLSKPHPFLLQRAADSLDPPSPRSLVMPAVYIGDSPDDIVAARRADGTRRWLAIGLSAAGSALRARQVELGADAVLEHPDQLMQLL